MLRAGGGDGLFNLGDPAARQWLTDYLSKCIRDWGIDIYRNDFNIDPLPFWRAADAPDRQGMAEIRYVEGLYRMWDDLRQRHPGLMIDNCASGGRRIDLETVSRSYPLWRSDTQCCGKAMPVQDQVQTAGLSLYVPLHAGGCWSVDPYCFRSIATTGTSFCPDLAKVPAAEARRAIAEMKALRPLYLGDYYPLLEINASEHGWCAWQFDRPELGRGFAMVFRRAQSQYVTAEIALHGLDAKANYEVIFAETYEPKPARTMSGAELARLKSHARHGPGQRPGRPTGNCRSDGRLTAAWTGTTIGTNRLPTVSQGLPAPARESSLPLPSRQERCSMRKWLSSSVVSLLVVASSVPQAQADVKLPKVIGSHMVLQRDRPLPIWGWADPGEEVTVKLDEATATAKADAQGNWKVVLPAVKADGKAHRMTVSGKNKIELDDILIGDVWIGSGQSNMEFGLAGSTEARRRSPPPTARRSACCTSRRCRRPNRPRTSWWPAAAEERRDNRHRPPPPARPGRSARRRPCPASRPCSTTSASGCTRTSTCPWA